MAGFTIWATITFPSLYRYGLTPLHRIERQRYALIFDCSVASSPVSGPFICLSMT
jgi:hypothetical protein